MQDLSLQKRISPPPFPPSILRRDTLVRRLEEVIPKRGDTPRYKLVVICAPAGYGKTALLADFAQYSQMPCCWYSLEEMDTDKTIFLTTLVLSIQQRF